MGKINLLSEETANLIAAGEVVDRPASVVKEMMENAIDASATAVTVEIAHGGVTLIRLSDNGCGIASDDLPLAIQRHATSKIRDASDLEAIGTLGFRGEALAAIAAVSQLRIISKTKDAPVGTIMTCDCGKIVEVGEVGCTDGTTVVVEDLFEKFPARRKFLKKDMTEASAVQAVVEKVAMSHPEIAFKFISDGNVKFETTGDGNLKNALYAIEGRDFAMKLLPVAGEAEGVSVRGFVGRSDNVRGNRNDQNVFLNGRYVKSKTVGAALERAFVSYIAPEKFPVCAIFLEVNPRTVDVNVHPSKLEVKFADEKAVFEAVYYAVRSALEADQTRPEWTFQANARPRQDMLRTFLPAGETKTKSEQIAFAPTRGKYDPSPTPAPSPARMTPKESLNFLRATAPQKTDEGNLRSELVLPQTAPAENAEAELPDFRYIGELYHCYLLVETGDDVLVIDKHAAHERILFEELKERMERDRRVGSQELLVPLRPALSPEEDAAARTYQSDLEAIGFALHPGDDGVTITAVPDAISISDAESLFARMADELASGMGNPAVTEHARRERALYQVACKAAIKGGRIYGEDQILWLIRKVLSLPDVTVCPHGRPIAFLLKKSELDRRFERI